MQGIRGNRVLLPTTAACKMTGFSRSYILRLVRNGRIEGVKLGHDWLIYEDSLKALMVQPRERGHPARETITMPEHIDPRGWDNPSRYFVADRSSHLEMIWLMIQDNTVTDDM